MRLTTRAAFLLLAGCLLAAPACGGRSGGGGPLVVYTRSGGITGDTERLTVSNDGRAVLNDGRGRTTTSLSQEQLARLRTSLQRVDWARVERERRAPGGAADFLSLSISFGNHRVSWTDVGPGEPELDAVVDSLTEVMSKFPTTLKCPQGGECSKDTKGDR